LPRSRYVMSMPRLSSVSSERSFLRKLNNETLNCSRSNRGIIQLKRRLTPCMRDPSQPRWSHTCRILSGFFVTGSVFYLDTPEGRPYTFLAFSASSPVSRPGTQPSARYDPVRFELKTRSSMADTKDAPAAL